VLALERRARRAGTGLGQADLVGLWWLERIWPRGQRRVSPLAGLLLRGLGACLRIEAQAPESADAPSLRLTNAVALGPLELRFQGPGWLNGPRPLLLFTFERLQIRLGDRVLLERPLPPADPRRMPFFALIATAPDGSWLAARGRSGGLALWCQRTPDRGGQPGAPLSAPPR
jgi:hypothetical protein